MEMFERPSPRRRRRKFIFDILDLLPDLAPEKKLVVGILSQAISDMSSEERKLRFEAVEWLRSRRDDEGSFHWTCEVLDLCPLRLEKLILCFLEKNK